MRFTLSNGALTAEACTEGGELISLRDAAGREYIWNGDPAFWSGRNPILFPIVGNLKGDEVDINGTVCRMSRHGFARRSEFTLAEQGNDFVVFQLRESENTLACYPYPFLLQVRHQLLENGFSTTFTVENPGQTPLPFCIGAHTAIRCPLNDGERFEEYQLVFAQDEEAPTLLLTAEGLIQSGGSELMLVKGQPLALDYAVFQRLDTIMFQKLASKTVSLLHRQSGRGVTLDFAEFPMVAFWTKPGAPYLCMEPWHGCAALDNESGLFQDKPFLLELAPGARKSLRYSFTLI